MTLTKVLARWCVAAIYWTPHPGQTYLQHLLSLPTPDYAHLTVAMDSLGDKLSEQTGASPLDERNQFSLLGSCTPCKVITAAESGMGIHAGHPKLGAGPLATGTGAYDLVLPPRFFSPTVKSRLCRQVPGRRLEEIVNPKWVRMEIPPMPALNALRLSPPPKDVHDNVRRQTLPSTCRSCRLRLD